MYEQAKSLSRETFRVKTAPFSSQAKLGRVAQIHRASKKNWVQRICIQLNGDIDCSIGWHKLHMQLKVL